MALRGEQKLAVGNLVSVRLLLATCGPYVLAFPADWVRGILMPAEAGRTQTVASAGIVYPLTNLAARLHVPVGAESAATRVILYGTGGSRRAFVVDQIHEMVDVNRPALHALPRHFRGEERSRLSGYIEYRDTVAFVINPLWLLESGGQRLGVRSEPDVNGGDRLTIACDGARPAGTSPAIQQLN